MFRRFEFRGSDTTTPSSSLTFLTTNIASYLTHKRSLFIMSNNNNNNENNNSRWGSGSTALQQLIDEQKDSESEEDDDDEQQPAAPPQGPQLPPVEPNQNEYCCLSAGISDRVSKHWQCISLSSPTDILSRFRMASCGPVTPRICSIVRKFRSEVLPHLSKMNFHIWSVFHGRTHLKEE